MVTTRRQSGAVSKVEASKALADGASDMDEDLSEESEEEANYKPRKTRRKSATAPKAKRQKTSKSTEDEPEEAPAKVIKRRRGKDLSLFVTMPLDILFAILSLLPPKDLVGVSRTNKLFHATLTSPNAKSVWIAARGLTGAPEPPKDIPETRWAGLLSKNTCQSCGTRGVTKADFMLRRRVCTGCKKRHLVYSPKIPKKFPNYDKEILNYLLYTNVGGWAHGHSSDSKYYWDEDVVNTWKVYSTLKNNEYKGFIGAKDAFKKWKEERLKWVKDNLDMARKHEDWFRGDDIRRAQESYKQAGENRVLRLAAVKQRFLEADYIASDIDAALSINTDGIYDGVPNVTNAVWSKLRPKLELLVVAQKEKRLNKELEAIAKPRMETFKGVYERYIAGLRPSEKHHSPAYQFLRTVPDVAALIDADKDTEITAGDFQPIVPKLPDHIAHYLDDYKAALAVAVPATDFKEGLNPLDMARFVFTCDAQVERRIANTVPPWGTSWYTKTDKCSSGWMIGWPSINAHLHDKCIGVQAYEKGVVSTTVPRQTVKLHERASVTARWLVTLAGLDPMTATIEDMDKNRTLFVCETCRDTRKWFVLDWRQAIHHTSTTHPFYSHLFYDWREKGPTFRLATDEEKAKAQAASRPLEQERIWRCDRCPSVLSFQATKPEVRDHIRTTHNVAQPDMEKDCFLNEPARWTTIVPYEWQAPKPVKAQSSAAANYQCLQCTEPAPARRRFVQAGVLSHLRDKHKVTDPKNNVHYKLHNDASGITQPLQKKP